MPDPDDPRYRRTGLSWRVQAMLWPAFCTIATWVVVIAIDISEDGLNLVGLVAWVLAGVPITVVVVCTLLGGAAVLVALAVRAVMRVLAPTAPRWVQAVVLAVPAGAGVAAVVMVFMTQVLFAGNTAADYWPFAVSIGVVAVLASAIYSRDLFDKRHVVGWRREGQ
ncbi:hypothetical protein R4172_05205 [Rhodococcus kroppenstedtii]|uniref:hypothetical protein n=2 Tax=Rhodococcoides kroppenstedtii TaxID=293050 RepID=UPI0029549690|nr:hypothetical protein [Rhodococcus kroppenstedtii]MDV7196959.1 hypothetical protein [Rhodococcus kroppenstedtii]